MSQNTSQTITIKVHNKDSIIATHKATSTPDNPTVITAQAGMNYELVNDLTNFAPENIKIKRVGNDLQLAFEDSVSTTFDPDLIIKDYYQYAEGDSPENTSTIIGMHENGSLYPYAPEAGLPDQAAPMLAQEVVAGQALGGGAITSSTQSNAIYWLAGLLVAGGLAAAGGGGGGNSAPQPPSDTTRPDKPIIDSLGTTNINKPTITGTAEPNSIITVVIKDSDNNTVDTGTTQTDEKGNWSYTPKTELPDGDNTVGATATDEAGNKSDEATTGVTIDTVSPELTVDDSATNDTTPTITGTVSEEATVHVIIKDKNDNVLDEGSATVNTDGTWSYTPTKALPEGEHTVEVTAEDKAGNKGSDQGALVLDTSVALPTITVIEDNDNNLILDSQEIGDKTEVTATVAVPDNAGQDDQIIITDGNGNTVKTLTVGTDVAAGGNTTIQVPINEDGSKVEIHVSVKDAVGNTDSSSTVLTINASSPIVKLIGDSNNDHVFNKEEVGPDNQIAVEITIPRNAQVGDIIIVTGNDNQQLAQWTVGTDVSAGETQTTAISVEETTTHVKVTATINNNTGSDEADVDIVPPSSAPEIHLLGENGEGAGDDDIFNKAEIPNNEITVQVKIPEDAEPRDVITVTDKNGTKLAQWTVGTDVTAGEVKTTTITVDASTTSIKATATITDPAGNSKANYDEAGVDLVAPGDTDPGTEGIEEAPSISIAEATDGYINYKELYGTNDNPAGIQTTVTLPTGTKEGDTLTLTFKQGDETITLAHTVTAAEAQSKSVALDILATGNNADASDLGYTVVNADSYALKDGDYTVTALVTDTAGNPGKDSSPVGFTVDTRPVGDDTNENPTDGQADNAPTVEIAEAKDNGFINKSELNNGISVKVTFPTGDNIEPAKAGDTVTLTFKKDGQADIIHTYTITSADATNGSAEITVPKSSTVTDHEYNFTDGGYTLTAVITDKAGNEGIASTPSQDEGTIFTVDTTADAPGLEWVTSLTSSKVDEIFNTAEAVENKVTLKVTAPNDAQEGETIAVIVNDKEVKTLTVGNDIPVQDSTNLEISLNNTDTHVDVQAVFTDQADNTATSATLSAGVDLIAPKVAINSITTSDTTPTITGTVDDKTSTVEVTISSDSLQSDIKGTAIVKADGTWSYTVPDTSTLGDGAYTVTATATDTAGNTGTDNKPNGLTIDTSAAIDATDDEVTAFFTPAKQVKTPALAHYESQETLELVNGQAEIAKLPFTLTQNDTIWLTVKQDNLLKLTDAFEVIVQNTVSGQEYTVASSSQQGGLLAGALSLEALGAVGDGTDMAFSVKDLPAGSYTLSVRGDSSKLAEALKTIDLSTLGSDTIEGLVKETVLDLLHDTLVGGDYDARSVLEQLSLSTLLKVAEDTPGLGTLLTAVDSALDLLLDNPLVKPLLGDVYNSSISDIVAGKSGGLLGGIVAITLGPVLNALIDQGLLAHLDSLGEALYDDVVEPLVSDVLMDTVLSGAHLDDALDGVLGTVRATLDTLGLGDILPTVDDVVDLVADQVLSNPATLFPGLVADVYTMDGTGSYHVEGNVTEDSTGGTHADNLGNATVVSISHTNGNSVTETKQLDEDSSQDNASITIDGDFGKLTVHEDGSFSYDVTDPSDITEAQQEVFTYTITDSTLSTNNSDSASLTIHINPGQENITITTDSGAFLQGGSGDDVLTGDSSSNTAIFYNLINTDPTGGNGKDTWTNFTLGDASVENSGADKIDISNLLINYAGDGSTASLGAYLQVESANGDTTIKIDRDGSASTYQSTDLMVLKGVETTLDQLNQNHQIII